MDSLDEVLCVERGISTAVGVHVSDNVHRHIRAKAVGSIHSCKTNFFCETMCQTNGGGIYFSKQRVQAQFSYLITMKMYT